MLPNSPMKHSPAQDNRLDNREKLEILLLKTWIRQVFLQNQQTAFLCQLSSVSKIKNDGNKLLYPVLPKGYFEERVKKEHQNMLNSSNKVSVSRWLLSGLAQCLTNGAYHLPNHGNLTFSQTFFLVQVSFLA